MKKIKDIKKELFDLEKDEYELKEIDDEKMVKNSKEKIKFYHKKCGKEFEMAYVNFFGKKEWHFSNRCPYCSHGHIRKTIETFKEEVDKKTNNEYEVVGKEYLSNKKPIEILHKKCTLSFFVRPDNFLNGTRCPYCKTVSKGENAISKYFNDNNISYKKEIWFDSCRDKWPLPFDYALYKDGKFCCLIEYYGIQHYQEIGQSPFSTERLKRHDRIKQEFCSNNKIPLVIIPYTEFKNLNSYLKNLISSTIPWEGELPQ